MANTFPLDPSIFLDVAEVMTCLSDRWGVHYDLQLVVRNDSLYLQMMWAYLEQQSFPLNEEEYKMHLHQVLEVVNRIGEAELVRTWLYTTPKPPKLGRAISLQLKGNSSLGEFVIGID